MIISENLFNQNIQAGLQEAKIKANITDQTNLTSWDVQVDLPFVDYIMQ